MRGCRKNYPGLDLILSRFLRAQRQHGSVTNVDDLYRLLYDHKQNSIGSAVAGAQQHLTDGQVEVGTFGREGTALGKVEEGLDTGACAGAPLSRGSRSTAPNVTIYVPKIGLSFGCDHYAIA